jgi:pimeloyl-ACP methyl ester carboxylesterase
MTLPPLPLPTGLTSRTIQTTDLNIHIIEAGRTPTNNKPLVILLHGFPEIAYSWRRVLPKLAAAGFYVVAPDQRGFGRTTGWDTRSHAEVDLSTFTLSSLVRDIILLVHALGYRSVRCIAGHDCGAASAAACALMRPDFFQSVALMSHPFNGSPELPFNTANEGVDVARLGADRAAAAAGVHEELANLGRKHYKWYYSTKEAGPGMSGLGPEEMHRFLRGYFHLKSGSWKGNRPHPLGKWAAADLAELPGYYIMPLEASMPATVARDMAVEASEGLASHSWLPDEELAVYAGEYGRTGFQGGLNWYRIRTADGGRYAKEFDVFAGKKIEQPCAYVSGKSDWGNYQEPGAIEKMKNGVSCADLRIFRLVDGVGHWTPQESPEEVARAILDLIEGLPQ